MENTNQSRPVVVTTAHRGVFVGRTTDDGKGDQITLTGARMIVYYSSETRGVVGLAQRGPQRGSRVSPKVDRIVLRSVTSVMDATEEAEHTWEQETWG